ncbi:MAG: hypothetical protein ACR652_10905 [Methylocystis sp.]|uniref:hypothetical protein n=1 Tax=Methylocystis sp. TaxID=1911079 RepID=UPI003DA4FE1E
MAAKPTETRISISAQDNTGQTFSAVSQRLRGLEQTAEAASRRMDGVAGRMSGFYRNQALSAARHADIAARMSSINAAAATAAAAAPVARAVSARGPGVMASATERAAETAMVAGSTAAAITPFIMKISKDASLRATENLRMKMAGMSPEEVAGANEEMERLAKEFKPVGQTTIGTMIRNARTIAGTYEDAIKFMDPLLKFRVLMQHTKQGVSDEEVSREMENILRAADLIGATKNLKSFSTFIEGTGRAMNVFGDSVPPSAMFAAAQHAGAASTQWSKEFVAGVFPSLIQTMGGDTAGTALGSMFSALVGGKMKVKSAKILNELGLIDPKKIVRNKQGDVAGIMPGGLIRSDLALTNPFQYATEVVSPALTRHKITDPLKITETLAGAYSDKNVAKIMTHFILNREQIQRDVNMARGGMDLSPSVAKIMSEDLPTAMKGLTEQFNALSATLGRDLNPKITSFANSISDRLREWEKKISEDPKEHTRTLIGGGLASIFGTHLGLSALGGYFGGPGVTAGLGAFTRTMGPIALAADVGAFSYKMYENFRKLNAMLDETDKLFQLPRPVAALTAASKGDRSGLANFGLGGPVMQAPVAKLEGAARIAVDVRVAPAPGFSIFATSTTSTEGALSPDTGVSMPPSH